MQKHHKKFSTSSILDKDADKTFIELKKEKLERGIGYNLDKCNYNQKELREYCVHMRSTGLALTSIDNRLKCLRYFFNYVKKKSKDITRKDIENFLVNGWKAERIVEYSNGLKIKKKQGKWMPRTEQLYKLNILYFYIWSSNITKYDRLPVHVEWIKRKKIQKEYIDNILTREEIKKIMGNTVCLRDRCIISILYDAGLRISELAGLRIKDIELDSYGASIKVSGKTGERKIRLIDSVPVLKQWLNEHPMKEDNNKELFICLRNKYGKPITSTGIYKIITSAVEKTGIKKRVYPHLFRHTKLTHMAQEGFNEMELRVFAGWSKSSSMPEVYLHIGSKELDEKIRNKNGMTTENEQKIIDEDKKTLKSRVCAMCNEQNDVGNKFCSKCGQILDIKVIKNIESTKDAIASLLQKDAGFLNKIVNEGVNKRIMELMKIMKVPEKIETKVIEKMKCA